MTIIESKIFQPSLKKSFLFFSAKNLTDISKTKNTVIPVSKINNILDPKVSN